MGSVEEWYNARCHAMKEVLQDGSKFDLRRREFDQYLRDAIGNATQALEFLRQLTICSRATLRENLLIFIEGADMMLPAGDGDVARMNDAQIRRVAVVTDWFSDPSFFNGRDTVCLVAESRSLIHRGSRDCRKSFQSISHPLTRMAVSILLPGMRPNQPSSIDGTAIEMIGSATAGLSLHAMRQLLLAADYAGRPINRDDTTSQVEQFIQVNSARTSSN